MPYIYSTCTNDSTYCEYGPANEQRPHNVAKMKVTIKGGNSRATLGRHGSSAGIYTPKGVVTKVTEEELEFLKKNKSFQRHEKAGHISYEETRKVAPEKMARDMAATDGSSPLTPADFEEGDNSTKEAKTYKKKGKLAGEE